MTCHARAPLKILGDALLYVSNPHQIFLLDGHLFIDVFERFSFPQKISNLDNFDPLEFFELQ